MTTTDNPMRDDGDDVQAAPAPEVSEALKALRSRTGAVTVTEWATAKGLAPELSVPPSPADKPRKVMKPVHNPGWARFRAAFFLHGWMENSERSEAEFDAAVAKANDPTKNTFR